MGPSECNHIQQRRASNRLEIDPKGEEEVVGVKEGGHQELSGLGDLQSHLHVRRCNRGSGWVYARRHHYEGQEAHERQQVVLHPEHTGR